MREPKPDPIRARNFAVVRHAGQTYNDEVPYEVHLDNVFAVANRFGFTDDIFSCACYLHDVIEDTKTSFSDVKTRFGTEVAELVYAVTNELGRNRHERHEKTLPKVKAAGSRALALKLCDRIANVEYGLSDGTGKAGMYANEFKEFAQALYNPDDLMVKHLWAFLARLLDRTRVLEQLEKAQVSR
jgi:(p)ppGpp synthase/HD superfamily hydrolase